MQVGENDQLCLACDDMPNLGWIERIPALLSAGKMLYRRAQIQERGSEQLISWLFDENFVARIEQRCHRKMVGHRGAGSCDHAVGIDSAFLPDGVLQGSVAVGAVAVDLQLIDGDWKLMQGERSNAAGREIESRAALGLRPQHVIGMAMSHRFGFGFGGSALLRLARLQYKYTGMPASRMISPMAEFEGKVAVVVITIAAQANTKRAVV